MNDFKRSPIHWAAITAALVAASTACRDAASPTEPALSEIVSREAALQEESFIVVLKEGTRDVAGEATRLAADYGATISRVYQHSIQGFAARLSPQALEELRLAESQELGALLRGEQYETVWSRAK